MGAWQIALIGEVMRLGRTPEGPEIFLLTPPPILRDGYGLTRTRVNTVMQDIVHRVANATQLSEHLVDVFSALHGPEQNKTPNGCSLLTPRLPGSRCNLFACDGVHLSDAGYQLVGELLQHTILSGFRIAKRSVSL